jgi:hypothetical protein
MATKEANPKEDGNGALEELTSTGEGAGLEVEPLEPTIHTPFDPDQIDVVTQPYTIDLLLSRLEDDALNLSPDFQRRANLWTDTVQSQLIESILLKIPLPSLYVSEDSDGTFSVVDGLQRLSAITRFVNVTLLTAKIKIRVTPLLLQGLESLKEFDGYAFSALPRPLQRRIRETQLTVHVIRAGTPHEVKFNIFARINQGGLPLTAQEIRNALYPGPARDWLRHLAEDESFLKATEHKIKTERMGDIELVLRFVSLFDLPLGKGRSDTKTLDDFLNETMARLNTWDDPRWEVVSGTFRKAMQAARKVFGRHAFRKVWDTHGWRSPINRGLFEAESVALARLSDDQMEALASHKEEVIGKLIHALKTDSVFSNALLYGTGSAQASNTRLKTVTAIFEEILNA